MSFKRRVLSALGKEELLEIGRGLELDVTTRMTVDELREALARSKRAKLESIVHDSLSRDTLKEICRAVSIDDSGKEKAALIDRIFEAGGGKRADSPVYTLDKGSLTSSIARERGAADQTVPLHTWNPPPPGMLPGFEDVATPKPAATKSKKKKADRRRGGTADSEAVIAGTLKAALQQFALGAAGGYSGRDAHVAFTTHLLECFGWTNGRPDGVEIPRVFSIADAGQRALREVALWWPERRTMMEVAPHDAVLSFAWKDLVRVCLQLTPVPQYADQPARSAPVRSRARPRSPSTRDPDRRSAEVQ